MSVGIAPWMQTVDRRMIRGPENPMDKSTIFSILPKEISERKPTMQPGLFELHGGTLEKPAHLVVGTSSWWKEIDDHQPMLEIVVSSIQVANSVVQDYCNGLLGCDMNTRMPGVFYLPGEYTVKKLKEEHPQLLVKANEKQRNWYKELIRIADILWARSQGNPLSISDDARLACRELNIENKPWLGDSQIMELVRCIACGSLRNPQYPICQSCKAIADPELAQKLGLQFIK